MKSSFLTRDWTRAHCAGSMESYPLDHQGSSRTARFIENSKVYTPDYKTDFYSEVLWPGKQVGIESGWCTVWEKETRERIKVSKMELGDLRLLGSRALFFGARSLFFSVSAHRKYLLCYDKISPVSPVTSPIAIFCFYSFPMGFFSWLSQSNRWLTINPCTLVWSTSSWPRDLRLRMSITEDESSLSYFLPHPVSLHWLLEQPRWTLIHWWPPEICESNFCPWVLLSSLLWAIEG